MTEKNDKNHSVPKEIIIRTDDAAPEKTALLVVDDFPAYRRLLRLVIDAAFPTANVTFRMCASGSEAVLAIQHGGKWDIGIIDLHLGDVPGEKIVEALRNSNRQMKILVLSGTPVDSNVYQAVRTYADEFIAKDFMQSHLIPLLETWLGLVAVERPKGDKPDPEEDE